uniref:Uncharacterized protein n=1 Tax=Solanum lycopersicum TaxID=4081 RepID=A0A3Q7JD01_SOLLC
MDVSLSVKLDRERSLESKAYNADDDLMFIKRSRGRWALSEP